MKTLITALALLTLTATAPIAFASEAAISPSEQPIQTAINTACATAQDRQSCLDGVHMLVTMSYINNRVVASCNSKRNKAADTAMICNAALLDAHELDQISELNDN